MSRLATLLIKHASASQVGNLLDIDGDKNHMCGVLNTWMGGCNNREECTLLGEVGVAVEDILGGLGLGGRGGLLGSVGL